MDMKAYPDRLDEHPLKEFFVWWDNVSDKQLKALVDATDPAKNESHVQQFLEGNPSILIEHLGGGHGRFVIPKKRLGSEFIPDFVIGENSSVGYEWYLVELESPHATMFTKSGKQSAHLTGAINQIQKWRAWLAKNQNYASRSRSEGGLGLVDISTSPKGLILIGRRKGIDDSTNMLRQQISDETRISIHTYDFLIDAASAKRHGRRQ